jgi:phenylacetate-CoA ligase
MKPLVGGVMRVLADFAGHTTQDNLKLLVERAPQAGADTDSEVARQVETRVRNALAVKVEVRMVRHGFFDAPGAQKVALTLRKAPDLGP